MKFVKSNFVSAKADGVQNGKMESVHGRTKIMSPVSHSSGFIRLRLKFPITVIEPEADAMSD